MKRILVTGGTGFIGRHLVPRLVEQGHEVVLLLREAYGLGTPLPPPIDHLRPHLQVVYADLRNFAQTSRAVGEAAPNGVLHLAAVGATEPFLDVQRALRHNLYGTLHLLRACFEVRRSVDRLVLCRTPGEATAMNVYAASKGAAWQFCRMYARTQQWPIVGATLFQTYGPGQSDRALVPAAFSAALQGQDFPMTSGEQERDWIYVGDVVDGLLAALLRAQQLPPATSVDLGTGRCASVRRVVETIYRLVDRGGRPLIGALPSRPGEAPRQVAAVAETHRLLDWTAPTSLEDGLRLTRDVLVAEPG